VEHQPVLVEVVVDVFRPALVGGGTIVDATLGGGGHAAPILRTSPQARLVGIDKDPNAVDAARANLAAYADRIRLVRSDFARLPSVLERLGVSSIRGVLLDLGVSSPQLDQAHRGFSFRGDGPLDMRMDPDARVTAADIVNSFAEKDLARIIRAYGEERFAGRIARRIVRSRPMKTTGELAEVVKDAIPAPARRTGGHPARRTFQALRIEVNHELEALEDVLPAAVDALEPGGRIVVISYHSLEDRRTKRFFAEGARGCVCPPDLPVCRCGAEASLRVLTRRPVTPSDDERERNPRSSAAKLRAAERIAAGELPVPEQEKRSA
jgi:16S rRNA (cytosine1402-N4)-methyltransferase